MTKGKRLFHFINGIWSGIPFCCVRHFVWVECGCEADRRRGYSNDVEYVQCDICHRVNKYRKIRDNGCILRFLMRSV